MPKTIDALTCAKAFERAANTFATGDRVEAENMLEMSLLNFKKFAEEGAGHRDLQRLCARMARGFRKLV